MKNIFKNALIILSMLVGAVLIVVLGGILFLSITEYKPNDFTSLSIDNNQNIFIEAEKPLSILSMNIGYGALDKSQDFFMDGGKGVRPASADIIINNMKGMRDHLETLNTDILLLQEVDLRSHRSYLINENAFLKTILDSAGSAAFAYNFNVSFVPIPFSEPIGKVESGLLTLNRFHLKSAKRISLPVPFAWPVRAANLKRCLLVERLPINGSEKELVIINLHLEAYDDGEGKAAQTKVLMDLLNAEYAKGNYCIAGGDFNQTFPGMNETFPVMNQEFFAPGTLSEDMLNPGWQYAFDGKIHSCRLLNQPYSGNAADTQYYVIDGFIISPNVILRSVKTIDMDFEYSDHNPVKIELVLGR
jgi:endonuclease/exonuclease/phosphatase family metal-dependent hydrolase